METVFRQKLELGLFNQSRERLAAMKTLRFSQDVKSYEFILLLIDYNPHSQILARERLRALPFADQVRVFEGGFAMWRNRLRNVEQK